MALFLKLFIQPGVFFRFNIFLRKIHSSSDNCAAYSCCEVLKIQSFSQRPFYAGLSPIGYPADTPALVNRLGDVPLPPQLNGDRDTANRLDNLPVEQQPIWWINRQQYEDALLSYVPALVS
ncbi:Uncharacterized protein OBRU01_14832, partial [Operophtera brumata]